MKNVPIALALFFIFLSYASFGQNNESLFSRLQGLYDNNMSFYNISGIDISSQYLNMAFDKRNIAKKFKKYKIEEGDLYKDDGLEFSNYMAKRSEEIAPSLVQYASYYFVQVPSSKQTLAVSFSSMYRPDKNFERKFIQLIIENEIPDSIYTNNEIDTINFAGRKIDLGKICNWEGVNNISCAHLGQMSWSYIQFLKKHKLILQSMKRSVGT